MAPSPESGSSRPADAIPIALGIVADWPAALRAAGLLFPTVERLVLSREELRPREPFRGPLFERLALLAPRACIALVVPAVPSKRLVASFADPRLGGRRWWPGETGRPLPLVPVADHVNLELRGPLTGRWPADRPRAFPPLAGIYQPGLIRAAEGARVYSSGVVVAGVADAGRLTPFEAGVVRDRRIPAVADTLVPPAIVAAYYGLTVAACGVPDNDGQ